jgi:hypothetical protein
VLGLDTTRVEEGDWGKIQLSLEFAKAY